MKNAAIDKLKPFGFKVQSRRAVRTVGDITVVASVYRNPNSFKQRLEFQVTLGPGRTYLVGGAVEGLFPELEDYLSGLLASSYAAPAVGDDPFQRVGAFLADLADADRLRAMVPSLLEGRCLVAAAARTL